VQFVGNKGRAKQIDLRQHAERVLQSETTVSKWKNDVSFVKTNPYGDGSNNLWNGTGLFPRRGKGRITELHEIGFVPMHVVEKYTL
jgi:hypothetical protein